MSLSACCSGGFEVSNDFHYLEGICCEERVLCEPCSIAGAVVSAIFKTLVFPITCALATIVFTARALYELGNGNTEKSQVYAAAAFLNLVGFVASMAFLVISAYFMPVMGGSVVVLSFMTLSIVVHVKRAAEAFPPDPMKVPGTPPSDEEEMQEISR